MTLGHGGIAIVNRATGISRPTINRGFSELQERGDGEIESPRRVRQLGADRPTKVSEDPALLGALESLIEPATRGDPQSPLRWTLKSLRVLATELRELGHAVSYRTVGTLLKKLGFSLQANAKKLEGPHPPTVFASNPSAPGDAGTGFRLDASFENNKPAMYITINLYERKE